MKINDVREADGLTELEVWRDLSYLKNGTPVQQEVFALLNGLDIMERLAAYKPLLAGTVPLGIQVEGSDLDIICEVYDREAFAAAADLHFGGLADYRCEMRTVNGIPRVKINFSASGWPVELFGQPLRTEWQNGYLHMAVEARILKLLGDDFRHRVIGLKAGGMKTEPAFARLLHLPGDPYESLLALELLPIRELEHTLATDLSET